MNYVESFNLLGIDAKQIPCITGKGAPTETTEGAVGCLYMNTDNGDVYKCVSADGGVYTWKANQATTAATDEKYFEIDYDGLIALKPEYRGHPTVTTYLHSVSDMGVGVDGSRINELPEKIIIPNVVDGTAVSGFRAGMFYCNYKVKEITIPDAVEELPEYVFREAMRLKAVHNTEHITKIGKGILSYTQVEKIIFPNLKEAATLSLSGCGYLYTVDIGNYITEIPQQMFMQTPSLSLVKGGANVKTIGKRAFYLTPNLKNLSFLSNVTYIGELAFYRSRIQFDWDSIAGQCTFENRATPVSDNTTNYWSGVEYTPCENPLVTKFSQQNALWKDLVFGDSGKTYYLGCAVFSVLHIHSALSGKLYRHPDEFAEDLRNIDQSLVTPDKHPTSFANAAPMFEALGYKATVYTDAITQDIYKVLCDKLSSGAYVYMRVSTPDDVNSGHVVVIFGINDNGEVLVIDSDTKCHAYTEIGVSDIFTYRMPIQNLTGPDSDFIVVEKKAVT